METKIWTISISSNTKRTIHFLFTGSEPDAEACAEELYTENSSQTEEPSPDGSWEVNELTPDFLYTEYNCVAELQTL